MKMSKNFLAIVAAALIAVAGIGFFLAYRAARTPVKVVTAGKDIAAYTVVKPSELKVVEVPKASVTAQDLTAEEYEKEFKAKKRPVIATMEVLKDSRLDERALAKEASSSFSVVSGDERVVAVTSSLPGAAIGTIHAGDVVDVRQDGGGGQTDAAGSEYAKVICISARIDGCQGVLPPGVKLSVEDGEDSQDPSTGDAQPVNVLLAVKDTDAGAIAGKSVALALNPFCTVKQDGTFASARTQEDDACQVPGDREASSSSTGDEEGGSASTEDEEPAPDNTP